MRLYVVLRWALTLARTLRLPPSIQFGSCTGPLPVTFITVAAVSRATHEMLKKSFRKLHKWAGLCRFALARQKNETHYLLRDVERCYERTNALLLRKAVLHLVERKLVTSLQKMRGYAQQANGQVLQMRKALMRLPQKSLKKAERLFL